MDAKKELGFDEVLSEVDDDLKSIMSDISMDIKTFNELILDELHKKRDVFFIDEIGNYEMTDEIQTKIRQIFNDPSSYLIATTTSNERSQYNDDFVKEIKNLPHIEKFTFQKPKQ